MTKLAAFDPTHHVQPLRLREVLLCEANASTEVSLATIKSLTVVNVAPLDVAEGGRRRYSQNIYVYSAYRRNRNHERGSEANPSNEEQRPIEWGLN